MPRPAALAALALLLGCGHTEPFGTPNTGTDQPFNPTPPVRLTLNAGADRAPAWLADGSGILYTAQQLAREDRDHCLALLPPTGGRQEALWCDFPTGVDWTDAILSPAVAADGRFAFLGGSSTINGVNPEILWIRVAPTVDPRVSALIRQVPYPGATATITAASHLRWLGVDRIAFIAQRVRYRDLCDACPTDTVLTNIQIETVTVSDPTALPVPVSGTVQATGLAPVGDGAALLYTLAGDSRIYRRDLASGEVIVLRDFGAAGVARDLHVAGNGLAVVVGGVVVPELDFELGPVQWDSGGVIHVLDLDAGTDVSLDASTHLFRRPALSPSGDRVVAEGYAYTINRTENPGTGEVVVDTIVSPQSDLYLLGGAQ